MGIQKPAGGREAVTSNRRSPALQLQVPAFQFPPQELDLVL
jgi:hypothetical protein